MAGYRFSNEYQDLALACLIKHQSELTHLVPCLQASYFGGVEATLAAREALDYYQRVGRFPTFTVLGQLVADANNKLDSELSDEASVQSYVKRLEDVDTADWEYVASTLVEFARNQAFLGAIRKCIDLAKEGAEPSSEHIALFDDALNVGKNLEDSGLIFHQDFIKTVDKVTSEEYGISTGYTLLDKIWKLGWKPGWLVVPLAPPKRYKCLGKGTRVVMFNGALKAVEDLVVGDLIMGDDSLPRTIQMCGQGRGPLFKVEQRNGDDFVCNDAHILCLMNERDDRIIEMTAEEYAHKVAQTPYFRREWQGYKVGVEFERCDTPLDPYFLGLWLGDGTSSGAGITVGEADVEIAAWLRAYAKELGMLVTDNPQKSACVELRFVHRYGSGNWQDDNRVKKALEDLELLNNKHVPAMFKINDRQSRLQLLAGLVDSDGSLAHNRGFIFTNTNTRLADDVLWLARSLGFRAYKRQVNTEIKSIGYVGKCWRVMIQGRISAIPVKLPRKRSKDTVKFRENITRLKVTSIGEGDYYGFTIDGNGRFLLEDFTVTHNTSFAINLALNMVSPACGYDVIYYACEISQELAMMRAMCNIGAIEMDAAYDSPEAFKAKVGDAMNDKVAGNLLFKSFASKSTSISDLRSHAKQAIKMLGIKPKMIVIDYAETVLPTKRGEKESDPRQQANIYTDARAMAQELGVVVVMPDRCNRETVDQNVPNMKSFQGAFEKAGIVDVAIGLCATDEEIELNDIRLFVFLNRHGAAYQQIKGKVIPAQYRIELECEVPYEPEGKASPRKRGGPVKVPDELL